MTSFPSELQDLLLEDEPIVKTYTVSGKTVYATSKRLLIKSSSVLTDIQFKDITRITYSQKPKLDIILWGIIVIVAIIAVDLKSGFPGEFYWFIALGVGLIIVGFVRRDHVLKLSLTNDTRGITVDAHKETISSLHRHIRMFSVDAETTVG